MKFGQYIMWKIFTHFSFINNSIYFRNLVTLFICTQPPTFGLIPTKIDMKKLYHRRAPFQNKFGKITGIELFESIQR